MKKILIGVSVALLAGIVCAATTNTIPAADSDIPVRMAWPAGKTHLNTVKNGWSIQYGQTTNNGTVVFSPAFTNTPAVFVSWDGVLSANAQLVTNAIKIYAHPTAFTNTCPTLVATHQWWMAVGFTSP